MYRRNVIRMSAMTALGMILLSGNAVAQQKSLKETLVGTWTLISNQSTPANSKGIIVFDAGGRYVEVNGDPNRPRFKSAGQPTGEELAAATLGHFAANFGTWSANEADKTITRHYEVALRPNNEGTDVKYFVTVTGDELRLSGVVPSTGAKVDSVYRRAK